VDDYAGTGDNGEATRTPMSQEQIDRLTALVKEAVGFDAARGDTVNVLNAAFAESPISEIVIPLWQQRWFLELVKWGVIAALALVTLLTVVRPLVRSALGTSQQAETNVALGGPVAEGDLLDADDAGEGELREDRVSIGGGDGPPRLGAPLEQLDNRLKTARVLVAEDPKRAVQVIKNWMTNEA
jgi:flagellar M-ring protein FliF